MSEDHLANKSQPPPAQPDAEYDLIYATVSETAQGRRFLQEYARRCRPSETEMALAAVERMQAAIRADESGGQLDLLHEMAGMAQAIARVRAEIMAIKTPGGGALNAAEDLDSIVHMTESATARILAATERMQEIAWTLRESGANNTLCSDLDAQASEIYAACNFQDLSGQRTRKVIQVLRYLEDRINATISGRPGEPAADDPVSTGAQPGVDAVMPPATPHDDRQEDRQDATLEDISRVMLALEPMMAFHQSSDDEPVEQPDANIVPEDVRPELSVAEAVMAEADTARDLAEWAVEPHTPAPPKPGEEPPPLTHWVVEDPLAPKPESEPAWMILHRMEAELDAEAEAEAHTETSHFTPAPPIPAVPAVPMMAESVIPPPSLMPEPALFVAEAMAQLEHSLRPAVMPPPELTFRTGFPAAEPLAVLQAVMEAEQIKLLQPGDEIPPASVPLEPRPEAEMQPPAETSELMRRAAAVVIDRAPEEAPAVESDADDFLFAPEEPGQHPAPAAFTPEPPATQQAAQDALQAMAAPPTLEPEWEGGTYPHPALVTPQVLEEPAPQAEVLQPAPQPRAAPSGHDPLAPLRALSEAQKIALFS